MGTAIDMAFDGATLAACPLSALVLSFAFYGFCGWAWESTVCAMLNQGRFANSGFLLGPCCPIYGVGGIACWLLLRGIPDASSQFVAAALVCSVIEYSVGLLLEKTTGARFWDYSHLPFNRHGRICRYWACALTRPTRRWAWMRVSTARARIPRSPDSISSTAFPGTRPCPSNRRLRTEVRGAPLSGQSRAPGKPVPCEGQSISFIEERNSL